VIRASDLIGCDVRAESGDELGRVHDLRAHEIGGEWRLVGLVVGRAGMIARLGPKNDESTGKGRVVPWEAITRLEDGQITVREEVAGPP
jgi:sporulation protein YlmC with PRC-barrel domain